MAPVMTPNLDNDRASNWDDYQVTNLPCPICVLHLTKKVANLLALYKSKLRWDAARQLSNLYTYRSLA